MFACKSERRVATFIQANNLKLLYIYTLSRPASNILFSFIFFFSHTHTRILINLNYSLFRGKITAGLMKLEGKGCSSEFLGWVIRSFLLIRSTFLTSFSRGSHPRVSSMIRKAIFFVVKYLFYDISRFRLYFYCKKSRSIRNYFNRSVISTWATSYVKSDGVLELFRKNFVDKIRWKQFFTELWKRFIASL